MSRAWHTFSDEAARICEHLGLNAADVVGFDIHIRVGELVTVRVEMMARDEGAKALVNGLKTIKFVQEPEPEAKA